MIINTYPGTHNLYQTLLLYGKLYATACFSLDEFCFNVNATRTYQCHQPLIQVLERGETPLLLAKPYTSHQRNGEPSYCIHHGHIPGL